MPKAKNLTLSNSLRVSYFSRVNKTKRRTKLSVNVNKIATLRNSRGQDTPNVLQVVKDLVSWGVQGITVHPRPDERHIKASDVSEIYEFLSAQAKSQKTKPVEFNIEGYPSADFLQMLKNFTPAQATLVPDPPEVLTSNAGWQVAKQKLFLRNVLQKIKGMGVRSSLFIDPADFTAADAAALAELTPDRVELYTERFAKAHGTSQAEEVTAEYASCARQILKMGIQLNAGHDLNQKNLGFFIANVPEIEEVSIGHALICESLYDGLKPTIKNYHSILGVF